MDAVTLALAKKYTDEKTSEGGSVPDATTTTKGIVKLNNTVTSPSTNEAATANAVKVAMDRADAAFQQANSGKTVINSAIGSPSIATDPFTIMATNINNAKSIMATNLSAKGQPSVYTESLRGLADKIANVSNGGKYATGTADASAVATFNTWADGSPNFNYIYVNGIGFKPKIIVLYMPGGTYAAVYCQLIPTAPMITAAYRILNNTYQKHADIVPTGNLVVTAQHFQVPLAYAGGGPGCVWHAWE